MHPVEDYQDGQRAGTFDVQEMAERTGVFKLEGKARGRSFSFLKLTIGKA